MCAHCSRRHISGRRCWRLPAFMGILYIVRALARGTRMAEQGQRSEYTSNVIGEPRADAQNLVPHVAYTDLREWIEEARKLGEIREVKGLSWQKDIGMAAEVILHDENAPCVIFEDVPGTLPGSRVLVNFFGGKRQKMTLGFPT